MCNFAWWKKAWAVFVICAATAVAGRAQMFSNLVNFAGTNGSDPEFETLLQGIDGHLYGTTWQGGDLTCNAPSGLEQFSSFRQRASGHSILSNRLLAVPLPD